MFAVEAPTHAIKSRFLPRERSIPGLTTLHGVLHPGVLRVLAELLRISSELLQERLMRGRSGEVHNFIGVVLNVVQLLRGAVQIPIDRALAYLPGISLFAHALPSRRRPKVSCMRIDRTRDEIVKVLVFPRSHTADRVVVDHLMKCV